MKELHDTWGWIQNNETAYSLLVIALLILTGIVLSIICRFFLVNVLHKFIMHSYKKQELLDKEMRVSKRLASTIPIAVVYFLSQKEIIGVSTGFLEATKTICGILFIVYMALFINELLDAFNKTYSIRKRSKNHSIKGYVQVAKIGVASVALILIIATLFNKSPAIIISGLGAIAAVIMFIFQHTLISFIANIQLTSSEVIKLDDWIEIPQSNISGEVVDMALHTITIRNWDNTLSRVPTKNFLTEPYTNWQPMFSSGGRRIKRSFNIDQLCIEFVSNEMLDTLRGLSHERYQVLVDYLTSKMVTLSDAELINHGITNLALFRRYIVGYLEQRYDICEGPYLLVRQLNPTAEGIPLEIYCFTSNVFLTEYEETQSEIFEYVLATAKYFNLRIYQRPSGKDMTMLSYQDLSE